MRAVWLIPVIASILILGTLGLSQDVYAQVCGDGIVEGTEQCDLGVNNGVFGSCCASNCTFEPNSSVCRNSAGLCDVADFCTGSSDVCPVDVFDSVSECRPSNGVCDVPEFCDGFVPNCPPNELEPNTTLCRPSSGVCDVAELCTGSDPSCPADAFEPDGTTCDGGLGTCQIGVCQQPLPPDQITDLSLTAISSTQVDLSWSTPFSSPPLLGYKIFRNLNDAGFAPLASLPDPLATSFSDTTLSLGGQVTYALISVNSVGGSGPSNFPPSVTTEIDVIEQILNSIAQLIADLAQEVADRIAGDTDLQNQIDVLGSIGLIYYVSQDIILPPGDFGTSWLLTCNPNEIIVSGGAEEIIFSTLGFTIAESYPNVIDGWIIRVDNPSVFDVTFRVWIVCMGFVSGTAPDVSSQAPSQEPGILEAIPIQKQIRDNIEN